MYDSVPTPVNQLAKLNKGLCDIKPLLSQSW